MTTQRNSLTTVHTVTHDPNFTALNSSHSHRVTNPLTNHYLVRYKHLKISTPTSLRSHLHTGRPPGGLQSTVNPTKQVPSLDQVNQCHSKRHGHTQQLQNQTLCNTGQAKVTSMSPGDFMPIGDMNVTS